jgi:hypothetical protein
MTSIQRFRSTKAAALTKDRLAALELRLKERRFEASVFARPERMHPLMGLVGESDEDATRGFMRFGGHATVVTVGFFTVEHSPELAESAHEKNRRELLKDARRAVLLWHRRGNGGQTARG